MSDDIDEIVRRIRNRCCPDPCDCELGEEQCLELRAADAIKRLKERCEAYKGQVKAGADEIERLKAQGDALEMRAIRAEVKADEAIARAEAAENNMKKRDDFLVEKGLFSEFLEWLR